MKLVPVVLLLIATAQFGKADELKDTCYRLQLSKWTPAMSLGGDEVYITPPSAFALTSHVLRTIDGKPEFEISPALGVSPSVHRRASWTSDGKKINLVWTNGFSGLSMELERSKEGLRGIAHTFWDFDRTVQSSRVFAQAVP